MRDEVSQANDRPRRRRVDAGKYPGLWERSKADGNIVFEIKLRQAGALHSTTLPTGTTRAQAITAWKKLSAQRDDGGAPLARNMRLADVAAEALAELEAKVAAGLRSQRTHDGYLSHWNRYISSSPLARKRLARISGKDVLALVSSLRKQGLAEWSAHGVVTCLRMILRYARHAGYMSTDPFASLSPDDLPRQQARETFVARVLRPAELERLIAATSNTYKNAVIVLAYTGLRLSELAGLTWADLDLVERVIHVRKQLAPLKRGEEPKRVKPKSKASVRDVPLVDRAYDALLKQLESEQARGLAGDDDFVFTSETGRPLGAHRLAKRGVQRAALNAGLGEGVGPQVLRRSVATATAHAKLPVVIAAAMTGHSQAVYDKHYAKPFRDADERARVRESLAKIGFGATPVDQALTNAQPE
jgi:integrase